MDYPTYLIHYGIPGQKWGVRKYQNEDGTWTEEGKERRRVDTSKLDRFGEPGKIIDTLRTDSGTVKYDPYSDFIVNKGSRYQRVTTSGNEKFDKRLYVGTDTSQYVEYLVDYNKEYYIDTLETKKDVIIAGQNTIKDILNEIGNEPAKKIIESIDDIYSDDAYDKDGDPYNDFLYKDKYKIADEFIKKLKNRGYDGLRDPADSSVGIGIDYDATVFVKDVLKKVKQEKH